MLVIAMDMCYFVVCLWDGTILLFLIGFEE